MPMPVLAEASTAPLASRPMISSISSRTRSGSAAGRSTLLMTGTISWSCSIDLVDVGERLRFDALRRVDDQQRAFARGEAPATLRTQNRRGRACPSG